MHIFLRMDAGSPSLSCNQQHGSHIKAWPRIRRGGMTKIRPRSCASLIFARLFVIVVDDGSNGITTYVKPYDQYGMLIIIQLYFGLTC